MSQLRSTMMMSVPGMFDADLGQWSWNGARTERSSFGVRIGRSPRHSPRLLHLQVRTRSRSSEPLRWARSGYHAKSRPAHSRPGATPMRHRFSFIMRQSSKWLPQGGQGTTAVGVPAYLSLAFKLKETCSIRLRDLIISLVAAKYLLKWAVSTCAFRASVLS